MRTATGIVFALALAGLACGSAADDPPCGAGCATDAAAGGGPDGPGVSHDGPPSDVAALSPDAAPDSADTAPVSPNGPGVSHDGPPSDVAALSPDAAPDSADSAPVAPDGPGDGASPPDDGPRFWGLSPGTNLFSIIAIANEEDRCTVEPGALVGQALPVTYDPNTGSLAIGNAVGAPPVPSLGKGVAAGNKAILTGDTTFGTGTGCAYRRQDLSLFELIGHDTFTLAVTETLSMFAASCPPIDVPPGGTCVSTWTWTLARRP